MPRYLVTGGAGFIGSHLVEALLADGHDVRVLDDLSSGRAENLPQGVELIVSSVTDLSTVRHALDGTEGCFHLAAIASVERAQQEWLYCHSVNLTGAITVFEAVRRAQIEGGSAVPVVYASSAAVYGNPDEIPISEESDVRPLNAYGADKLGCELHAVVASRFDVRTVGLRFFNVYGPRQSPNSPYSGVISIFCQKSLQGAGIQIHGDGKQVRDFVYVGDAVNALCRAMASATVAPAVFNVCTGTGTTISQLGEKIAEICGVPFAARHVSPRAGDLRLSVGSPRMANEKLGFATTIPLEKGLAKTLSAIMAGDPAVVGAAER